MAGHDDYFHMFGCLLAGTKNKNIHYHQCTGGGLRKGGGLYSLTMARSHPYRGFFWQSVFDQRGRSSPPPLAFRARWDLNHGVSPWNPTPHCQLIITNYVGRAGTNMTAYMDGALTGSSTIIQQQAQWETTSKLSDGSTSSDSGTEIIADGQLAADIHEIAIWHRALAEAELTHVFMALSDEWQAPLQVAAAPSETPHKQSRRLMSHGRGLLQFALPTVPAQSLLQDYAGTGPCGCLRVLSDFMAIATASFTRSTGTCYIWRCHSQRVEQLVH
jgi:hypothetical protein